MTVVTESNQVLFRDVVLISVLMVDGKLYRLYDGGGTIGILAVILFVEGVLTIIPTIPAPARTALTTAFFGHILVALLTYLATFKHS